MDRLVLPAMVEPVVLRQLRAASRRGAHAPLAVGSISSRELADAALGSDSGGSIRIPSASCGLFGLKPQRGRVTTAPHPHLWWALGTAGPLARTVLDSALVYDVIRGNVDGDLFRAGDAPSFAEAARVDPPRLRIGWSIKPAIRGIKPDPVHVRAVEETARLMADLGHDVREIDPRYPDATTAFVPQFFAGIRAEADAVEHYERLDALTLVEDELLLSLPQAARNATAVRARRAALIAKPSNRYATPTVQVLFEETARAPATVASPLARAKASAGDEVPRDEPEPSRVSRGRRSSIP